MAKPKKAGTASAQPQNAKMPAGFTVTKQVILPVLSLQVDQPRVVRILEAMRVSTVKSEREAAKGKKGDESAPNKPATVAPVVDMESGENFTMIVPAVLEGNLKEQYPSDSYVGKCFYLMKKPKRAGKRYFDFEISEVEPK